MKRRLWPILYALALGSFTTYLALDTFVLPGAYQVEAKAENTELFQETEVSEIEGTVKAPENKKSADSSEDKRTADSSESGRTVDSSESERTADSSESERTVDSFESEIAADSTGQNQADDGRKTRPQGRGSGAGNHRHKKSETGEAETQITTAAPDTGETETWENENARISLTTYKEYDTKIYVADIVLTSAQYLKTAFAEDTYGKNITADTSEIASTHGAILAINGDYYGARESGVVIRNGIVYREPETGEEMLCLYADGSMKVVSAEGETGEALVKSGVWQAFSFGPGLIEEGKIAVTAEDEVGRAMASNPRTAIGMISPLHYVFVVSDGRTEESAGLSLSELAAFLKSLGATEAYNLDGGGSSTLWFNGSVVNQPTTNGTIKERSVSDIVYIGK